MEKNLYFLCVIILPVIFDAAAMEGSKTHIHTVVPSLQTLALKSIVHSLGNILDETNTSNKRALEVFFTTADERQEAIPPHFQAELIDYLVYWLPDAEAQLNPLKTGPEAIAFDKLTISDVVFIAISARKQEDRVCSSIELQERHIYPHLTRTYCKVREQHSALRDLLDKAWLLNFSTQVAKAKFLSCCLEKGRFKI